VDPAELISFGYCYSEVDVSKAKLSLRLCTNNPRAVVVVYPPRAGLPANDLPDSMLLEGFARDGEALICGVA